MNALGRDGTVLVSREHGGYFFPGGTPLALFTDEIHKWLKAAVKGASAADSLPFHWLRAIFIHQGTV